MLATTFLIVFREVIEAGLIAGIVLAATKGVPRRSLWVGYGVIGGVAGACIVAFFASSIANLFEGSGQELFNASVLLIAVVMLAWHNVWMASHGKAMASEMQAIGSDVAEGRRSLAALALVVGIAVLREGAEVVLFLYGIAAGSNPSMAQMLAGGALGIVSGVLISALMYFGLLSIPVRKLFAVTTGLITLVAAGMASQAISFLQQAGHMRFFTTPLWNSSWLLTDGSVIGKLLSTLVGYTARPNGTQLIVYLATILIITGLMWLTGNRKETPKGVSA